MVDYQQYRIIARLISREISGEITPEEQRELVFWVNELPENGALYHRIRNSGNFRKRNSAYEKIDILSGWERLEARIERAYKIRRLLKISRYAAAILIPLMIAGVLFTYIIKQKPEVNPVVQVARILPGKPRAVLMLDNGKLVSLDSLNHLSITEKDGTLIEKGAHSLNYSTNRVEAKEKTIFNTIKIPRGGEYELVLADGTRVYLNAESGLKYPVQFSGNIREVELTGEAYFEVAKNTHKPFVVKTTGMSVEVLGTSFNLNAYEDTEKILTTLVEGSVKINIAGSRETILLKPDEQALLNVKSGQTGIRKVDVSLYTDWKDGRLNFFDDRLEDIMITLTRWYSADVIYKDESIRELRFSGSLNRYGDISQILDIIRSTGKVKIEAKESTIVFSE